MRNTLLFLAIFMWISPVWGTHFIQDRHIQKRVFFTQDKQTLIAIDTQTARSIEFRLRVRENILAIREADAVIAVATDQRLFAFSVHTGGWRPFRLRLRENLLRLQASGFSIFAETTDRIITFNGLNGAWFARRKSIH